MPDYSRLDEVLGIDTKAWPTHCLVQYPSDFDTEIDKFVGAVEFAVQGSIFEAREALSNIKSQDLSNWFIEVGQNTGIYREASQQPKRPRPRPKGRPYAYQSRFR